MLSFYQGSWKDTYRVGTIMFQHKRTSEKRHLRFWRWPSCWIQLFAPRWTCPIQDNGAWSCIWRKVSSHHVRPQEWPRNPWPAPDLSRSTSQTQPVCQPWCWEQDRPQFLPSSAPTASETAATRSASTRPQLSSLVRSAAPRPSPLLLSHLDLYLVSLKHIRVLFKQYEEALPDPVAMIYSHEMGYAKVHTEVRLAAGISDCAASGEEPTAYCASVWFGLHLVICFRATIFQNVDSVDFF